ncbi:hypothetical protein AGDE_13276 [Angomonas deanei]|nr:hypothetical protein AGDE_13276 [Angomonas deanei]|eukprot:EPY22486.1 hypothetical protein AGDE_13276 [Angomonas deanei]
MSDTAPDPFFAQWTALQERVNELTNEKMAWVEKRITLKNKYDMITEKCAEMSVQQRALVSENRGWREKYGRLKKEHDALVEEHQDYMGEMVNVSTRLKEELEEAKSSKKPTGGMDEQRKVLLDKFYDCSVGQFDLIALFNYYKAYGVSADVMKETLTADHRETLTLPDDLNTLVGEANVKQFFEKIIAALPNLRCITGHFKGPWDCYVQYKQGGVALPVLEAFCGGYNGTSYQLTQDEVKALQSAELSVSDYLITVLPLLPRVTDVWVFYTNITTLDWCEAIPERVSGVDIDDCPDIQDCTPLLKMKGLKRVGHNAHTNPSFDAVQEQLIRKGVMC